MKILKQRLKRPFVSMAGLEKSRYVVKSEFPKESYETDEDGGEIRAVYKLNGGGEVVELSTSNSNIEDS